MGEIYLLGPEGLAGGNASMTPFMHMERPCTCTCLCLNRPEVSVTDSASGEEIGSIREPFACCNLQFSIHDPDGNSVLQTDIPICRCGLCCPCPCGPCSRVVFPVTDSRSGNQV